MAKAKPPVDPKIAAVLASVFAVLGVFGVFERLELSADEVAILLGSAGALLTTLRATLLGLAHRKAVRAAPSPSSSPDDAETPKPDSPETDEG